MLVIFNSQTNIKDYILQIITSDKSKIRLETFHQEQLLEFMDSIYSYKKNIPFIQEPGLISNHHQDVPINKYLGSLQELDWNSNDCREAWIASKLRLKENQFCQFQKLSCFIGTFNVNDKPPNQSLDSWLIHNHSLDMYILGFQEVDTTTEAYLVYDPSKEIKWSKRIEQSLEKKGSYVKIVSKQLIGILTIVYIKKEHHPFLKQVSAIEIPCGLFGVLGNKGAVAVHISLYDSFFCFVNAHLAADTQMFEKRNQDFEDISRRILFKHDQSRRFRIQNPWIYNTNYQDEYGDDVYPYGLTQFDSDYLIWHGDMNYRLDIGTDEARKCIEDGKTRDLLRYDQLLKEMNASNVFFNFKEGEIHFPPSYKYDNGTSFFDSSEKKRTPSWTDRILCFVNPKIQHHSISLISYSSCMDITLSDHKPVYAIYGLNARKIDAQRLKDIRKILQKDLDKKENDTSPKIELSHSSLDFGQITANHPTTKPLLIHNLGSVPAFLRFNSKSGSRSITKPWCFIHPQAYTLLPNDQIQINIRIQVDYSYCHLLNQSLDSIQDILIISVNDGRDKFLSINGEWQNSCFGFSIKELCQFMNPIRSYSSKEICKVKSDRSKQQGKLSRVLSSSELDLTVHKEQGYSSIPKEIWRLTDYLLRCDSIGNLENVNEEIMHRIRDCLDTGNPLEQIVKSRVMDYTSQHMKRSLSNSSVERLLCVYKDVDSLDAVNASMMKTLLDLLQSSSEALVPSHLHRYCYPEHYSKFVEQLDPIHYNCFMHIIALLPSLNLKSSQFSLEDVTRKFIPSMFKIPKQSINTTHKHIILFIKYVMSLNKTI